MDTVDRRRALHHFDCGVALMRCNRHAQALIEFEQVLHADPVNWFARWNRALALLALGDYAAGMPEHDTMWQIFDHLALAPPGVGEAVKLPAWQGEHCRLLVYHQMGFGDAIMCLRFLPELVRCCENVTLVVRSELVGLMQGYGARVVDYVPALLSFDAQVSMFNAIWVMKMCDAIPSRPYIDGEFKMTGGKMGIVWSGYSQRAFNLDRFLARLDRRGFQLYALHAGDVGHDVAPLATRSFAGVRDLMLQMDAIITVDTAAAHLAGALGHPNAHVLIPYVRDWRWWHAERWYPTLKLHVQPDPYNWDHCFDEINEAVHAAVSVQ